MYARSAIAAPPRPTGDGVSRALARAGLSVSGVVGLTFVPTFSYSLPTGTTTPNLTQQQAIDSYLGECGYDAVYALVVTAAQPTATPSTVTVTATVGDPTYAGPVQWFTGNPPVACSPASNDATAGVATLSVTGNASGPITVWAYVPEYTAPGGQQAGGYSSVVLQFP